MALNEMQARFVDAYVVEPNATKAAIAAGYSERTAASQGQRLLKNVEIQRAIEKARKASELRTGVTVDRVKLELARIAFGTLDQVGDWGTSMHCPTHGNGARCDCINATPGRAFFQLKDRNVLEPDQLAMLSSVKVKRKWEPNAEGDFVEVEELEVKIYDKLKALELLGKHLGMFEQKITMKIDTPLDLSKLTLQQKIELEALLDAASPDE